MYYPSHCPSCETAIDPSEAKAFIDKLPPNTSSAMYVCPDCGEGVIFRQVVGKFATGLVPGEEPIPISLGELPEDIVAETTLPEVKTTVAKKEKK